MPLVCPYCLEGSPAVWCYNLHHHLHYRHRSIDPAKHINLWKLTPEETEAIVVIWQTCHKQPKCHSRGKQKLPLKVSEAHSSCSLSRYVNYAIFISLCITTNCSYIVQEDDMKSDSEEDRIVSSLEDSEANLGEYKTANASANTNTNAHADWAGNVERERDSDGNANEDGDGTGVGELEEIMGQTDEGDSSTAHRQLDGMSENGGGTLVPIEEGKEAGREAKGQAFASNREGEMMSGLSMDVIIHGGSNGDSCNTSLSVVQLGR
jgi:hypothetical protein